MKMMPRMKRTNISGNLCRTEGSQSVPSAVKKQQEIFMKTKLFITAIPAALLVLGLFLIGCPTGGGGGGGDPVVNPYPETAPVAPSTPLVVAADQQLTVSWTAVPAANSYQVFYGTANNSAGSTQWGADVTGTSATITGLLNGTTYYVWLKAKNAIGISGFSSAATGTPEAPLAASAAPGAPQVVAADQQLAVSWSAVAGASVYQVWYGTGSDPASAAQFGADVSGTTAAITGLTNGVTYYVWIKAKNAIGTSGFSPPESVFLMGWPGVPSLTAGVGRITASWSVVADAYTYYYEVWYGITNNSASAAQFGTEISGTTATITGLTNGVTYYVWIKAKNAIGISGFGPSAFASPFTHVFTTPANYRETISLTGGALAALAVTAYLSMTVP
jgi:hypothetical protein